MMVLRKLADGFGGLGFFAGLAAGGGSDGGSQVQVTIIGTPLLRVVVVTDATGLVDVSDVAGFFFMTMTSPPALAPLVRTEGNGARGRAGSRRRRTGTLGMSLR
jgi:hypothetical protein